jgi:hypothetical protein
LRAERYLEKITKALRKDIKTQSVEESRPRGKSLECILLDLAREWLEILNRLLIVEDPEPAPRSPNKLTRVQGAERGK